MSKRLASVCVGHRGGEGRPLILAFVASVSSRCPLLLLSLPVPQDDGLSSDYAAEVLKNAGVLALVEDAISGVEAGKRGGFGAIDHGPNANALRQAGATIVVQDLSEFGSIVGASA